jgi:hypothetical protein
LNHRTPLNSLNSLRDRLTQKITKYVIKVCDLAVFRWTKNNSELWYIAILQKNSHLKNSVFWFSLVFEFIRNWISQKKMKYRNLGIKALKKLLRFPSWNFLKLLN